MTSKINNRNTIDNVLNHIVKEKEKLSKITKKVLSSSKKTSISNNKNNTKKQDVNKDDLEKLFKMHSLDSKDGLKSLSSDNMSSLSSMNSDTMSRLSSMSSMSPDSMKSMSIDDKDDEFENLELKNISPETGKKIIELLKNYVKMDKSFRLKHESLKTLYNAYLALYKKYKDNSKEINNKDKKITSPAEHDDMLKQIHSEMKDNNSNLYKERLIILKKIKDSPEIETEVKNKICGRLLVIFKAPPVSNYTQLPMLEQVHSLENTKTEEKINIKELDDAYLQKHNELMTVYKAYQNLFNIVLNYKEQLEKYKQLPTGSSISRTHMDKLIKDQGFVMDMIDKMQDQLVSKNIISNMEKVPVNPVASHPENIGTFNNTMREQINHIIDRQVEIKPDMKIKIEDLLSKYKDCDSNDKFCQSGRQLLLLKKM